jgi:hypothetical protein
VCPGLASAIYCILHTHRRGASTQTTPLISLNPQQSSVVPSVPLFKLEDHDSFPDSDSEDLDDCSLQLAAHSASKSRSPTPKGRCPVVEPVGVMSSLLLEHQRARGRATVRQPDDHQRKHRFLNPQRRQRDPNQLSRPSRGLTSHLRAGGKRTTP